MMPCVDAAAERLVEINKMLMGVVSGDSEKEPLPPRRRATISSLESDRLLEAL